MKTDIFLLRRNFPICLLRNRKSPRAFCTLPRCKPLRLTARAVRATIYTNKHMLIEANAARAIKAVTNNPLDIPESVEVIDVCKAIEEMMNKSEERGERRMLVKQVRKGRITIEQTAEDANMSVEQFKNAMDDMPLQVV